MKKKSSLIAKSVMAAAVATSVVAVANPANAASVSQAEKAVVKAEKLANALKWEISLEYRKSKYPDHLVDYPNMKLHNDTVQALAEAKKQVSALKTKDKDILSARLDANVVTYVNRSVAFTDAVTSGLKIQKKYNELNAQVAKGIVDDKTEELYHQLSREIQKNAYMLDRVYGVTTRTEFREFYKRTAEKLRDELLYPVTIKMEIDQASKALKAGNVEEAAQHLEKVNAYVKEAAVKKGQKADNKLIVGSLAKLASVQAEVNQKAATIVNEFFVYFGTESYNGKLNGTTVDLSAVDDSKMLSGIKINTTKPVNIKVTSIMAGQLKLINQPITIASGTVVTTNDLFKDLNLDANGVSLAKLRTVLGNDPIVISGTVIDQATGTESTPIQITIQLKK